MQMRIDVSDPFLSSSIIRFCALGNLDTSCGMRDESMVLKETDGNFMSSRASLIVKATWGKKGQNIE